MHKSKWSPIRILAVGFAVIIIAGGLLLTLPISSKSGTATPFIDALFTAGSASCVTGLIVYDTWAHFSMFGQVVILLLIQIGGLGFLISIVIFSLMAHKKISLGQRVILADSIGFGKIAGIVRTMKRILIGTAFFEGLGALILSTQFIPRFGWANGIWFSIFHSVSAFCNAGFDVLGIVGERSSLSTFYNNPVVIITIAMLIIIGGIGFVVWNDLWECKNAHFRKKLALHTKVALISTAILILGGTIFFLFSESGGVLASMSAPNKVLSAFFQSVTPRTAGFNSVDEAALTDAGKFFTIFLMFVGAAPGGTGGGIKITTAVVVGASALSSMRTKDTSIGHFRIEADTVKQAMSSTTVYLVMVLTGVMILCFQGNHFLDSCFECFSAIGTVGLTTGITGTLSFLSKVVIILLMYMGRIGSMSIFLAVRNKISVSKVKDPVGHVIVS